MNTHSSNPEPLQIGLGRLSSPGRRASRQKAARQLLDQALAAVDTGHTPVRCFLLLATADWCNEKGVSLPAQIRKQCKDRLGYDVSLIGGSLASLFYLDGKTADEDAFIEHGAILVAFCSHDFWVTVEALDDPHRDGGTGRFERIKQLSDDLLENAGTRLGASAARHLLVFSPGIFLDQQGNQVYQDNELHEEIVSAFDYRYRVVGAAAADALEPTVGYQFANDRCLKSGLAVGLVETDLASGTMMGHGFSPVPDKHLVVDKLADGEEMGYEVAVLDGEPATQRLEKFCENLHSQGERVFLGLPDGPDHHVLCAFKKMGGRHESVRLNRRVRRGDRLSLLHTSAHDLEVAAQSTTDTAVTATGAPIESLRLICDFTCSARLDLYGKYGHDWKEVTKALQQRYPLVPLIGGLGSGEFGVDRWRRAQANNVAFWVICVASFYAQQASTRRLQNRLFLAANRIRDCQKPKEVMLTALQEAVAAGATGGQIAIVDDEIGRIISLDHGCAYTEPSSKEDWASVVRVTDRSRSESQTGDGIDEEFPTDLLEWSMVLDSRIPPKIAGEVQGKEDILALIVRTRCAVFVADAKDPIFRCDKQSAVEGGIATFLAIPLIGSTGKAIATLQLSLSKRSLDRESFGLWVGYAKELAAALERAQEKEEREISQAMSELGTRILQTPPTLGSQPHAAWCGEYVSEVQKLLGAHDVHIRLRQEGVNGEEYHLVAGVGPLSDLLRKTRPVTRPGQGNYNFNRPRAGGYIKNTKEETLELNKHVKPIKDVDHLGAQLLCELGQLEATAVLPLKHGNQDLGLFIIDSMTRYFFTERKTRLARAAVDLCGAILRAKTDAYDRAFQESEQLWLLRSMAAAKEGATSLGLMGLLKRLCGAIGADVGSLFLWCEPIQKLVLHTSFNWFRNLDGKATYAKNEGWTGTMAFGEADIVIVGDASPDLSVPCRKYYEDAIPPQHRLPVEVPDPRIALRLKIAGNVVGVATFAYYKENWSTLHNEENRQRVRSLLMHVDDLVKLAVEDARTEAARIQHDRLLEAKNQAVERLMVPTGAQLKLKPVLDILRKGFCVTRVRFYRRRGDVISFSESSLECRPTAQTANPIDCLATREIGELIEQSAEIFHPSLPPSFSSRWPQSQGVRSLFAVSASGAKGDSKGVLEFINREENPDHPFAFLDEIERVAAREVARAIGVALEHEEHELAAQEERNRRAAFEHMEAEVHVNRELARGEKEMRDAFEDVAHQIKSPLGEATRRVERAATLFSDPVLGREFETIASMLRRAELSAKLVGLFSKLARGEPIDVRGTPHGPINLADLAETVCKNQRPRISAQRGIQIDCDDDSFRAYAPASLSIDADLLTHALTNLVDNAIKYSYRNTTIRVFASKSKRGDFFIGVSNKGIPISPREIALVKQRNWRGKDAQASVAEGNGIGLWIVDHIMRAMGGELLVLPTRVNDGITEVRLKFSFH